MQETVLPILIYQGQNWEIALQWDRKNETIWASQWQMVELFWVDQSVISRHIRNIFNDEELRKESNMQKMHIPNSDKPVTFYSLDMILSIGYRVNSKTATQFRKRATKTLKQHITQGYTLNSQVLEKNYLRFQQALTDIQTLSNHHLKVDDVFELIKIFSKTWFSLDAFDKGEMLTPKQTASSLALEAQALYADLLTLKEQLMSKGEATDFFAQENSAGSFTGIFGNIFQTAFGDEVYPSIEAKAVHLLYFVIKNHPFTDGNKRSGAFAFIRFLQKSGYEFRSKITPEALTAITLLIATSDPKDKEKMIQLVMLLLQGEV